jgi:hypothetical protein
MLIYQKLLFDRLFTRNGTGITAKGVMPVCLFQQVFKSLYLFGAFLPIT